eukprot:g9927.t1
MTVHFSSVLFYYFYEPDAKNPCVCRSGSWCLPYWVRAVTNSTLDVWMVGRDTEKTVYRMDARGCFVSLKQGLATHSLLQAQQFDLLFIFEVNSFMHPEARGGVFAKKTILYPTYNLSPGQIRNFESQKVAVLRDDQVLKPPNPELRKVLEEAYARDESAAEVTEESEEALAKVYGIVNVSALPYPNATEEVEEWVEENVENGTNETEETFGATGALKIERGDDENGGKRVSKKVRRLVTKILPYENTTASRIPSRMLQFPRNKKALVYPAALKPSKGQLAFLNMLYKRNPGETPEQDENFLDGIHVYFVGGCAGNVTYCSQTMNRCGQLLGKKAGVSCTFLNALSERELALVYKNVAGTVLYTNNDCNPRIMYESMLMNKPFFSTNQAQIPALMQHLGHLVDFDAEDVAEEFGLFVNALDKNMWGERPRKFALEQLGDHVAYGKVISFMEKQWWG